MPSHREVLQSAVADAERRHNAENQNLTARTEAVNVTKAKIADLQRRLDTACLEVANSSAKAEDTVALEGEIRRHQHRLRGEDQLHQAAIASHSDATSKLVSAQNALVDLENKEEMARLEAAVESANQSLKAAEGALKAAHKVRSQAVYDLSQFRKKLARDARAVA